GIEQDGKIGSTALPVDRITRLWFSGVELGRRRRGEVPSRREAEDADAIRIDLPLRGPSADGSQGTLRILDRRGVMILGCQAVLQNDAGDTNRIEPSGDLIAFMIHRQGAIASTRTNNDGSSRVLVGRRKIDADGGRVFRVFAECSWRAVGPERLGPGFLIGSDRKARQ